MDGWMSTMSDSAPSIGREQVGIMVTYDRTSPDHTHADKLPRKSTARKARKRTTSSRRQSPPRSTHTFCDVTQGNKQNVEGPVSDRRASFFPFYYLICFNPTPFCPATSFPRNHALPFVKFCTQWRNSKYVNTMFS